MGNPGPIRPAPDRDDLVRPSGNGIWSAKRAFVIACCLWGIAAIAVSILVIRDPVNRSVCHVYSQAARQWWAGQNMYYDNSIDGFLYLPQSAILYTPFVIAGSPAGDVLWRLLGLALFCHGLWRIAKMLSPANAMGVFALASFLAVAPTMGSLRNGQASLLVAALMLQATAELMQNRWWPAVAWLTLGLAVKPVMIVMILLAAAVYRPMRWRLVPALVLLFVLPWATQAPGYVLGQYGSFCHKFSIAVQPDRAFEDLTGVTSSLGWVMPPFLPRALQLLAAAGTLGLCLLSVRRRSKPAADAFLLAFAACYLMLFSPRTETSSYVIVAPVVALAAAIFYLDQCRPVAGSVLALISLCMFSDAWAYNLTAHWLKPLSCAVFMVLAIIELVRRATPGGLDPRDGAKRSDPSKVAPSTA